MHASPSCQGTSTTHTEASAASVPTLDLLPWLQDLEAQGRTMVWDAEAGERAHLALEEAVDTQDLLPPTHVEVSFPPELLAEPCLAMLGPETDYSVLLSLVDQISLHLSAHSLCALKCRNSLLTCLLGPVSVAQSLAACFLSH